MIDLFGEATSPLFKGLGQPYRVTVIEVTQSLLLIGFVLLFADTYGLIGAAVAWLPAVIVARIISVVFVKQLLEQPFVGFLRPMMTIVFASAAGALIALGVDQIMPGFVGFVLAAGVGLGAAGLIIWFLDRRYELGFARDMALFFPQISSLPGFSHVQKEPHSI